MQLNYKVTDITLTNQISRNQSTRLTLTSKVQNPIYYSIGQNIVDQKFFDMKCPWDSYGYYLFSVKICMKSTFFK